MAEPAVGVVATQARLPLETPLIKPLQQFLAIGKEEEER
jgi:hypothetical protein